MAVELERIIFSHSDVLLLKLDSHLSDAGPV